MLLRAEQGWKAASKVFCSVSALHDQPCHRSTNKLSSENTRSCTVITPAALAEEPILYFGFLRLLDDRCRLALARARPRGFLGPFVRDSAPTPFTDGHSRALPRLTAALRDCSSQQAVRRSDISRRNGISLRSASLALHFPARRAASRRRLPPWDYSSQRPSRGGALRAPQSAGARHAGSGSPPTACARRQAGRGVSWGVYRQPEG